MKSMKGSFSPPICASSPHSPHHVESSPIMSGQTCLETRTTSSYRQNSKIYGTSLETGESSQAQMLVLANNLLTCAGSKNHHPLTEFEDINSTYPRWWWLSSTWKIDIPYSCEVTTANEDVSNISLPYLCRCQIFPSSSKLFGRVISLLYCHCSVSRCKVLRLSHLLTSHHMSLGTGMHTDSSHDVFVCCCRLNWFSSFYL